MKTQSQFFKTVKGEVAVEFQGGGGESLGYFVFENPDDIAPKVMENFAAGVCALIDKIQLS